MNREFIKQRIDIFSGTDIDPNNDAQVIEILQRKFDIHLPQRSSLDDALEATSCDHDIIGLIIKYRAFKQG
ncbi:MAG: hypothetical protein K6L81_03120 [Agarilytica sp.]